MDTQPPSFSLSPSPSHASSPSPSSSPSLPLSISVVSYDSSLAEIRALIVSLLDAITQWQSASIATTTTTTTSLYLIDNSEDACLSRQQLADLQPRLTALDVGLCLLSGHGNIGYGAAHNLAIAKASDGYHLLLNPDIVLDANCLLSGITFMQQNPDVLVASPLAKDENGEKQHLCKRYPALFTFLVRGFFPNSLKKLFSKRLARFEMHELSETAPNTDVALVSGCFMLCQSRALKQVQGFDANYFLYFEDFDLSLRLGKLGKVAYVPAMKIQHRGGQAASKGLQHIKLFIRSGLRFFNSHGWCLFRQSS